MLLYTKLVKEEPKKRVYGTLENVPAESDKEVTLMDAEGAEFKPVVGDTYLDNGHGGIVRKSDGKAVNVIVDGKAIIGEKVEKAPAQEEPVVNTQTVKKAAKKAVVEKEAE